jgi:protein-arginine kinase activator protein McsA
MPKTNEMVISGTCQRCLSKPAIGFVKSDCTTELEIMVCRDCARDDEYVKTEIKPDGVAL